MVINKEKIINLFYQNVYGKKVELNNINTKHCGKKGYWLEEQFGIKHNNKNSADLYGYELKNQTTSKTTFGDWSANEYIFNNPIYFNVFNETKIVERRNHFLQIFGKLNIEKGGRYSWSGNICPKIHNFNNFGQRLLVVENNDVIVEYSYENDMRDDKKIIVPLIFQKENIILARWYGNSTPLSKKGKCLKNRVDDKFNDKGWFICKTTNEGIYNEICFGQPINFNNWIELLKKGVVYFDSGMYETNPRPYSQWRANNNFWNNLIIEKYT